MMILNYDGTTLATSNEQLAPEFSLEVFGDELAVEAAVLDEDFVRPFAGDDDASEIDAGHVRFEGRWVADGAAVVGLVKLHAETLDEVEVGMVPREREYEVIRNGEAAARGGESDVVLGDVGDGGGEVRGDLPILDAVIDVGQDPVFDVAMHLRTTMDKSHLCTMSP